MAPCKIIVNVPPRVNGSGDLNGGGGVAGGACRGRLRPAPSCVVAKLAL